MSGGNIVAKTKTVNEMQIPWHDEIEIVAAGEIHVHCHQYESNDLHSLCFQLKAKQVVHHI